MFSSVGGLTGSAGQLGGGGGQYITYFTFGTNEHLHLVGDSGKVDSSNSEDSASFSRTSEGRHSSHFEFITELEIGTSRSSIGSHSNGFNHHIVCAYFAS